MRRNVKLCIVLGLVLVLGSTGWAKEVRPEWEASLLDDATLHDVTFVARQGWAVGEHGVIRRTTDGGETWSLEQAPKPASLRSVCFLTNRIGWIAGGYVEPFTQAARGVLFVTQDGGENWTELSAGRLPYLQAVKFFSLDEGVAVGGKLGPYGSGLLQTHDGGKTWRDLPADAELEAEWRTGDFLSPERGGFAGRRGAFIGWGGDEIRADQQLTIGQGTIRDVHLSPNGSGWLAGEQALLLRTSNAGVGWESPPGKLPHELRDVVDFLAVTQRDDHVWVAGRPGTVIWHSPDRGRTWRRQATGVTTPIRALHFRDERHGVAVGDMGVVLRTDDGGATWSNLQQQRRRAGMLLISSRADAISFPLLNWYAGENGYRSVALVPIEQETDQDVIAADLRLTSAVTSAGGNAAFAGTRLPVGLPDLQSNRLRLISEWNSRTDGRLTEVLLGGLVAEIRQWRPEVVVLTQPAPGDETTELLNQAVHQAVRQAGDPTRFLDLAQGLGLRPWQVPRVVTLKPTAGPTGAFFSPSRPLVRTGLTLADADQRARSRAVNSTDEKYSGYGVLSSFADGAALQMTELFKGLDLPAGGDARRKLIALTPDMADELQRGPQRAEQVRSMAASARQKHGSAQPLMAVLPRQLERMDEEDAAKMLLELARGSIAVADWWAAEAFLIELVNRYEQTPAGQSGAKELVQLWSSEEIAWMRSREVQSQELNVTLNRDAAEQLLHRPLVKEFSSKLYREPEDASGEPRDTVADSPIIQASASLGQTKVDWHGGIRSTWLQQAGTLGVLLSKRNPALFRDETVQRSLAVVNRQPKIAADLDVLYQRVHDLQRGVPTNWLLPPREPSIKNTLAAHRIGSRPELDGQLTDDCWKTAEPQVLKQRSGRLFGDGVSLVMMGYDDEMLYLAASLVKSRELQYAGPQPAGRRHDEELTGHDRLSFAIDIDRDYELFYELTIDERGRTSESLGGRPIWNPGMFIATKHDREHWRLEAAIPLRDLAPTAAGQTSSWGLAIRRIVPAQGWESWQGEARTEKPEVEEFGRLQLR